jgi:hypothetical protein
MSLRVVQAYQPRQAVLHRRLHTLKMLLGTRRILRGFELPYMCFNA